VGHQSVTKTKPVVANPAVDFAALLNELQQTVIFQKKLEETKFPPIFFT
jgi:hypothetical protein